MELLCRTDKSASRSGPINMERKEERGHKRKILNGLSFVKSLLHHLHPFFRLLGLGYEASGNDLVSS